MITLKTVNKSEYHSYCPSSPHKTMDYSQIYLNLLTFWPIKTRSSKSQKIDIFPKGLTHGFGPKMAIFPTFFFRNRSQENVFYNIVEQRNAFLGYQNKKFQMSKSSHFSKGVNPWFWSKSVHFSTFFFREYRPGYCLLGCSRTKKRLFRL